MRRFVFLLIAVLLLQFNWIAAASACTHETGAGARHFGHHQHEHNAADAKFGEYKKASNGGALADDDCAVCHMGCGAASSPGSLRLNVLAAHAPAIASAPMILAAWPDPPDRPRWPTAS
ncbi:MULTISPECIES: hypothetical protein [Ramlibacter]|uniref:Cobalt-zinc-cadmium resistance protein n=1 Tax=Ramlibacter aquaticus TaxID=2780094 RepID=A0ABR9SEB3_9BURK|nr:MULTISPECIES: hypothetical protein [Ramlibacter]MBE7940703.1 hypothetical protein [Ramlibacter aquaticus]